MDELNTIENFKLYIGKTIYAVPTGNNARGNNKDYIEFEVRDAKRKYVELLQKGYLHSEWYLPNSGSTKSSVTGGYGGNAGYIFYTSPEAILTKKALANKLEYIKTVFSTFGSYRALSDTQVEQVFEIIKGEN